MLSGSPRLATLTPLVDQHPPTVLFICTGNICRSPFMELYFKKSLISLGLSDVEVISAGTTHVSGHGVADSMADILYEEGITVRNFQAQGLTSALIDRAALIITAEVSHRATVVRLQPRAHARVFTLLQSARLLRHFINAGRLPDYRPAVEALAQALAASRGFAGPSGGKDDSILDPWGRSRADYQLAASTMSGPLQDLAVELSALHHRA